jgi:hypothetical protein
MDNHMKCETSIVFFGLMLILAGCSMVKPISESDRTFYRVVDVPGYTKDQIYFVTKIWIAENFTSAKSVIEFDSKDDGIIIGNGNIKYPCSGLMCLAKDDWRVPFTMRIDMKDQKFRIGFSNIKISWPASYQSGTLKPAYEEPVNSKKDMDAIRPVLLKFGDEIKLSVDSNEKISDW